MTGTARAAFETFARHYTDLMNRKVAELGDNCWQEVAASVLRHWLENDFRAAVLRSDMLHSLALLAVGHSMGEEPAEIVRKVIAAFVRDLIDPQPEKGNQ